MKTSRTRAETSQPDACQLSVQEFMQRTVPLAHQGEEPPLSASLLCHIFLLNCVLERSANRECERHQLTLPQWLALGCIGNEGKTGTTHSELCHRLMLSKAPVTGIVDRLVRDGYVRRVADTKDKRVSRIVIKPKGVTAWGKVRNAMREHSEQTCRSLSDDEQQTLITLLGRLMENVACTDPLLPEWERGQER